MYQTSPEGFLQLERGFKRAAKVFAPPPKLTVSAWADRNRRLSSVDSAEPGQWNTSRAEYQRGIMDAFTDPEIEDIVIKASAQVGKTQTLNNCMGYVIDQDPGPMLVVVPTKDDALEWSKDRFMEGMVLVTPCLLGKIAEEPGKKARQTNIHKKFPGGQLTVAWSNSPSRLAARPIRYVFMDEVDKYKPHPGQGDPKARAKKRTTTFWNRKHIESSTPTIKGVSTIDKDYEDSDQRKFNLPCPHCGDLFVLDFFQHIRWPKEEREGQTIHLTAEAFCVCPNCGAEITEAEKPEMIAKGVWIAENPGGKVAGFFIWEGYSPWVSWADIADKFIRSRKDTEALRIFYNESLGLSWEIQGQTVKDSVLMEHKHAYIAEVPKEALVITAAGDVQDDRIEVDVRAWDEAEQSWSIEYRVLRGDPGKPEIWQELDGILSKRYQHESGVRLPIICTMIDSAGHHTQMVYKFCESRWQRHIYACIGRSGIRPLVSRPSKLKGGGLLFTVGVDTAKELIYARLMIDKPGPGYCHFPDRPEYDSEYFKQLTAEKLVTKFKDFKPTKVWVKTRPRNEALDNFGYSLAALEARKVLWPEVKKNLEHRATEITAKPELVEKIVGAPDPPKVPNIPPRIRPPRRGHSWIDAPFRY
jgi:phage terminase large subunit GpA-like protein